MTEYRTLGGRVKCEPCQQLRQKQARDAGAQLLGAQHYAQTIDLLAEGHYQRKAGAGALLLERKQGQIRARHARDTVKSYWSFTN